MRYKTTNIEYYGIQYGANRSLVYPKIYCLRETIIAWKYLVFPKCLYPPQRATTFFSTKR